MVPWTLKKCLFFGCLILPKACGESLNSEMHSHFPPPMVSFPHPERLPETDNWWGEKAGLGSQHRGSNLCGLEQSHWPLGPRKHSEKGRIRGACTPNYHTSSAPNGSPTSRQHHTLLTKPSYGLWGTFHSQTLTLLASFVFSFQEPHIHNSDVTPETLFLLSEP